MSHRIALLIHSLQGGGAERLMSQLAERWSIQHEVHLITWTEVVSDHYAVPAKVERHGLGLARQSKGLLQGIAANAHRVRALRSRLRDIAPSFVLSFSDQMNILSLEATRPLSVRHWISEHSHPGKQRLSRMWELWRRRSYPRCAGCTVLTNEISEWMQRLIPRERIRVIPPAIADPQPRDSATARAKTILFVGRLSPEKRVDNLLMAWSHLAQEHDDWTLRIVGDGTERQRLEAMSASIPRVEFIGWTTTPADHYATSSVFVLPSQYEGFPVALLEAMSHGVPCLSTNCTDAIDQLTHRAPPSVLTTEIENVPGLASQLAQFLKSPELREQFSTSGQHAANQYTWTTIGPLWDSLLSTE